LIEKYKNASQQPGNTSGTVVSAGSSSGGGRDKRVLKEL